MYIEYTNPNTATYNNGLVVHDLLMSIDSWAKKYSIDYKRKIIKNKIKITFTDKANYSFFAISFKYDSFSDHEMYAWTKNFVLKEPMKID